ncbi:phosphoglycerate kinase [Chloroflexus islandicus]|uniref:Phosphoglycerate kinase n=1 Tax=Chloroflexus islandicus TaxID=1707952 RepID=A0A178M5Y8_9CHLR|nr:histidine phosphatase family protein [Chloroflexus islandicus]OAN42804.1 phosphoglycerate kinase [Chloroflexus islandicus]
MRLILIRHGETPWNRTLQYQGHALVPLNERGREQARRAAFRLARSGAVAIYSSDLPRAWETAEIIGEHLSLRPIAMPDWREIDVGLWEGLTPDELYQRFPDHMREYDRDPAGTVRLGGESYAQLQARVLRAFRQIESSHQSGETIIVVSHGGSIRALFCHIIGLDLANFGKLWLDNGSLSEIVRGRSGWRLLRMNDVAHLEDLVAEGGE